MGSGTRRGGRVGASAATRRRFLDKRAAARKEETESNVEVEGGGCSTSVSIGVS